MHHPNRAAESFVRLSSIAVQIFIASLLFSIVSVAQPISITDFRIPTSQYQRFLGSLGGSWNKNSTDYDNSIPSSYQYNNSNFNTGFNYVLGQFSEDRSLEITASTSALYNSSSNTSDEPAGSYHGENSSSTARISLSSLARYNGYIEPDKWFWTAQLQGNGNYGYNHNDNTQRGVSLDTSWSGFNRDKTYQYSLSAGVGYGKMRDGQSIFAALRVLDKLQEDGALVRPLTRDETLRLADYLARQSEYVYSQDRYNKFLMEDVFKTLDSMQVIKGGAASAFDVMRAYEVLEYERIEPRLFGWRVSASVMRSASQNGSIGNNYSNLYHNAMEYLQLQSDYGYPLSLNTQLAASGAVLVPRKDSKRRVGVTFTGSMIYQMTDRIDASVTYSLNRTSTSFATDDNEDFSRDLYHRVSAGLRFFIENNVTFNVNAGYQYQKSSMFLPITVGTSTTYSSTTASFGLTYRFF